MKDFARDNSYRTLVGIIKKNPQLHSLLKTAAEESDSEDTANLPSTAFADSRDRMFPIHSKSAALLSFAYAKEQKADSSLITKIANALELFGEEVPNLDANFSKTASGNFLLPKTQNYPANTSGEVKTACEYFINYGFQFDYADRKEFCSNLVKVADSLGVSREDVPTMVKRYAGTTGTDLSKLAEELEGRIHLCRELKKDIAYQQAYAKIAVEIPNKGVSTIDAEAFDKIAHTIKIIDTEAEIQTYYGRRINDPYYAVFNTDKQAEESVNLDGMHVPVSSLMALRRDDFSDLFGDELAREVYSGGDLNVEEFKAIVPTLPLDMKQSLAKLVRNF